MKIPSRKLARKLARMAAAAGMSLREFVNRGLALAATEERRNRVFISHSYDDALEYNRAIRLAAKASGASWALGKENG